MFISIIWGLKTGWLKSVSFLFIRMRQELCGSVLLKDWTGITDGKLLPFVRLRIIKDWLRMKFTPFMAIGKEPFICAPDTIWWNTMFWHRSSFVWHKRKSMAFTMRMILFGYFRIIPFFIIWKEKRDYINFVISIRNSEMETVFFRMENICGSERKTICFRFL